MFVARARRVFPAWAFGSNVSKIIPIVNAPNHSVTGASLKKRCVKSTANIQIEVIICREPTQVRECTSNSRVCLETTVEYRLYARYGSRTYENMLIILGRPQHRKFNS